MVAGSRHVRHTQQTPQRAQLGRRERWCAAEYRINTGWVSCFIRQGGKRGMDEDHEDQAVWRLGPGFQHGDRGRGGRGWVMKRRGDRGQPGCRSALSLCGGGVQRRNDLGWPELWGNLQLVGWCAGVFPLTTCGWMTFSLCTGVSVVMMVGGVGISLAAEDWKKTPPPPPPPPISHSLRPKTLGF